MKLELPELVRAPGGNTSFEVQNSTWQSLTRGTGSVETEYLNGEIVRLAAKVGMKAPLNAGLVSIMKEMVGSHAMPGRYSPSELIKILGLKSSGA